MKREIRRLAKLNPKPVPASVFVARKLTKGERYMIRGQAFKLLVTHNREQVIDTLLMQHEFLSWRQANLLVRQAERALTKHR